ncbi:histidine--tRNA ligase [Ranunculus cassubicifolius]
MAAPSVITIGGKDSYLSPSTVYSISTNSSNVQIDSSVLEKLPSKPPPLSSPPSNPRINPKFLSLIESKSILITILNKLVRSNTNIRPILLEFITKTLNLGFENEKLDVGSVYGFLECLFRLNNTNLEEIGVTDGELNVVKRGIEGLEGIAAIIVHCASGLSMIGDGIAGLTIEAVRGDVSGVYKYLDSGDGLSNKDKAGVASDLKVLLNDSKLAGLKAVGRVEYDVISKIPQVHGGFRSAVRLVQGEMRSLLNNGVCCGEEIAPQLSGLACSLVKFGESSLSRMKLSCESIAEEDVRLNVLKMIEENCPSVNREVLAKCNVDYASFVHELYDLVVKVRDIVSWEGAVALMLLERNESAEKTKGGSSSASKGDINGGNVNQEKRGEKKKKKVSLGKGTAAVKQLLKEKISGDGGEPWNNLEILNKWACDLSLVFNPKESELDDILKRFKEIVESNESRRLPKLPKGTRDFAKEQMTIREKAFAIIQKVFKRHGATALDTPVFEMRETLMGKYGEDSKLIYDLADQGGELCSLRYDLTVPFARYIAQSGLTSFKRYQIAKVYRRDNPSKGRFREFYQCDFDIAGQYESMGPDFEVVKVLTELLDELNIGDYEIKLNHRKLLDGMLEICGVPPEKFRTICSSVDKLDKQSFEQIKKEMVEEKGLSAVVADKIGNYVKTRGQPLEILSLLKKEGSEFLTNTGSKEALGDLDILFRALDKSKCIHRVVFDLSLARGLDYYTGVIFEAVFKGTTEVVSIAAGGRYDNLIGMFGTKQVPAVGVSLGIERVFTIMEQLVKDQNQAVRATETQVLVGILGDDLSQAAELVSELWKVNVNAEYMVHKKPMKFIERAIDSKIPWVVIEGEKERNEGIVKLKDVEAKKEESVPRNQIVEEIQRRLQ